MGTRLRRLLLGNPRDLRDQCLFHRLSLVPFLAWVGLGAGGLSSSAYGPEGAVRALGEQAYLAPPLAALRPLIPAVSFEPLRPDECAIDRAA